MNSKKQEINWKLIGASEHINYLRREIEYVAKKIKTLDMAVLISGPSGTGKELIAKAIAEQSGLKLVTINCGAIPRELFESELFGYVPGAFTGALKKGKKGFVEAAKGGILFLDEIGDLTLENQGKVLRLLQERTYYKVGSEQEEKAEDLKIMAATNRVLTKDIIEKRFREDLWYRLKHRNVQTIPFKDRRVDIICLVNHFVHETKVKIDPKVKFMLYSYDFPGNVRELESLIYSSDDF
jgi:sigma-54 dependent transcriptional regulator, acetoin dehydrogenase operon transcriptional activator AcoR